MELKRDAYAVTLAVFTTLSIVSHIGETVGNSRPRCWSFSKTTRATIEILSR